MCISLISRHKHTHTQPVTVQRNSYLLVSLYVAHIYLVSPPLHFSCTSCLVSAIVCPVLQVHHTITRLGLAIQYSTPFDRERVHPLLLFCLLSPTTTSQNTQTSVPRQRRRRRRQRRRWRGILVAAHCTAFSYATCGA